MHNPFLVILKNSGQSYQVERDGKIIATYQGVSNRTSDTHKNYVGFIPGTDIKPQDWLINLYNERFYVQDVKTTFFMKEPNELKAFILTKVEFENLDNGSNQIYNITNAYGSIIGNQSNFTLNYSSSINELRDIVNSSHSSDKEELNKIIDLLEMITNNQIPISKGLFSKFANILQKNSWITSHIASILVSWLTDQI